MTAVILAVVVSVCVVCVALGCYVLRRRAKRRRDRRRGESGQGRDGTGGSRTVLLQREGMEDWGLRWRKCREGLLLTGVGPESPGAAQIRRYMYDPNTPEGFWYVKETESSMAELMHNPALRSLPLHFWHAPRKRRKRRPRDDLTTTSTSSASASTSSSSSSSSSSSTSSAPASPPPTEQRGQLIAARRLPALPPAGSGGGGGGGVAEEYSDEEGGSEIDAYDLIALQLAHEGHQRRSSSATPTPAPVDDKEMHDKHAANMAPEQLDQAFRDVQTLGCFYELVQETGVVDTIWAALQQEQVPEDQIRDLAAHQLQEVLSLPEMQVTLVDLATERGFYPVTSGAVVAAS